VRPLLTLAARVLAAFAVVAGCDRRDTESRPLVAACSYTRADTLALVDAARDTVGRLKRSPQRLSEITAIAGGISVRTEDADSNAFHHGGAVSFDSARQVNSVWLDGG
jgi:hypothetical protein